MAYYEDLHLSAKKYEELLDTARNEIAVLQLFVAVREKAGGGDPTAARGLELQFAAAGIAPLEDPDEGGSTNGGPLPAATWIELRSGDTEAVLRRILDTAVRYVEISDTRVEPAPNLALLLGQLAAMIDIPADVVEMIVDWTTADPRTLPEITRLLHERGAESKERAEVGSHIGFEEIVDLLQLAPRQASSLRLALRGGPITLTPPPRIA